MQEHQSWSERPHEELVKAFKNYVQEQLQKTEGVLSPEEIICLRLAKIPKEAGDLYLPLIYAWDALAHDGYKRWSMSMNFAVWGLTDYYQRTQKTTIELSGPQIRIIDALTEACGIPHERELAVIEIPEKLRDNGIQLLKEDYGKLVAGARSRRNKSNISGLLTKICSFKHKFIK
jgi:hypothetical protein